VRGDGVAQLRPWLRQIGLLTSCGISRLIQFWVTKRTVGIDWNHQAGVREAELKELSGAEHAIQIGVLRNLQRLVVFEYNRAST
jgi:hypothetical protein